MHEGRKVDYGEEWGLVPVPRDRSRDEKVAPLNPTSRGTYKRTATRVSLVFQDPYKPYRFGISLSCGPLWHSDVGNKVIINQEFARKQFPGEDPLGKHLQVLVWSDARYGIIVVVGDTLHQVNEPVRPTMYFPQLSGSDQDGTLVERTAGDPLLFSGPVQKLIAALDPELPASNVLTMEQTIGDSVGDLRIKTTHVLLFAALSLLLASVGLYGVLSYLITLRTTELGIRIVLGAQRDHVLRLMLLDGLQPALFGLVMGLALSAAA